MSIGRMACTRIAMSPRRLIWTNWQRPCKLWSISGRPSPCCRQENTMQSNSGVCIMKPLTEKPYIVWEMSSAGKQEPPQPKPVHILLVDDNPGDVRIILEGL